MLKTTPNLVSRTGACGNLVACWLGSDHAVPGDLNLLSIFSADSQAALLTGLWRGASEDPLLDLLATLEIEQESTSARIVLKLIPPSCFIFGSRELKSGFLPQDDLGMLGGAIADLAEATLKPIATLEKSGWGEIPFPEEGEYQEGLEETLRAACLKVSHAASAAVGETGFDWLESPEAQALNHLVEKIETTNAGYHASSITCEKCGRLFVVKKTEREWKRVCRACWLGT